MSADDQQAGSSSGAGDGSRSPPITRSKVIGKPEDQVQKSPELYKVGQEVYVLYVRGRDLNPFTIHEVLGNGQYKLKRDGKVERKIHYAEKLSTKPQA